LIEAEIKQKIEERLDIVIEKIIKLVDNYAQCKNGEKEPEIKQLEESQVRNVLNMANALDSIEALMVFIQYQMARNKIPRKFGNALIEDIKTELNKLAEEITAENTKKKQVWLSLIRNYLGYLNMYFVYKKKIMDSNEKIANTARRSN